MAEPQRLVIEGWLPPHELNGPHQHWATRRQQRLMAGLTVLGAARHADWRRVEGRVRLTVTFVYPRKYRIDAENLHARLKGPLDALKGEYFVDDSMDWLDLVVRVRVEKGRKATELVLEEA